MGAWDWVPSREVRLWVYVAIHDCSHPITLIIPPTYSFTIYEYFRASGASGFMPAEGHMGAWEWVLERLGCGFMWPYMIVLAALASFDEVSAAVSAQLASSDQPAPGGGTVPFAPGQVNPGPPVGGQQQLGQSRRLSWYPGCSCNVTFTHCVQ